jgi:tagaturonate epimerase
MLAEATGAAFHVKTSGTSYLEALRVIAEADPYLLREILPVARNRFATDRRTYALSEGAGVPQDRMIADAQLAALLDDPGARQGLHVTYGAVLTHGRIAPALVHALETAADPYADALERHLTRHLLALDRAA